MTRNPIPSPCRGSAGRCAVTLLVTISVFLPSPATAQSTPPRDDSHWVPVPGTRNFAGSQIPTAAAIDELGRITVAFNVVPSLTSSAGFVVLARYDTTAGDWTLIGGTIAFQISGVRGVVAKANGDIYVAGNFVEAVNPSGVSVPVSAIARWNDAAQSWDDLGGGLDGPAEAVGELPGGDICVAGSFATGTGRSGGQVALRNIGCFDGGTWYPVGGGIGGFGFPVVTRMAISPTGEIVVTGNPIESFDTPASSGVSRNGIALWDGATWNDIGGGLNTLPFSIAIHSPSNVLASGINVEAATGSGTVSGNILKWNGTDWSRNSTSVMGNVSIRSVAISGNETAYAADNNTAYRRVPADTAWSVLARLADPVRSPFIAPIATTSFSAEELYIGGRFDGLDGPPTPYLPTSNNARWDGTSWRAMDDSTTRFVDDVVHASANAGGDTYGILFGGRFRTLGPLPARRAAFFDGESWTNLAGGITSPDSALVYAIESSNPDPHLIPSLIFVGGDFDEVRQPDGTALPVSNVAVFSRQSGSWASLGQGVNGPVRALAWWDGPASDDEVLYVGGEFTQVYNADGTAINTYGVARWVVADNRWERLGSGLGTNIDLSKSVVYALDVAARLANAPDGRKPYDHDVFVGGRFDRVVNLDGTAVSGSKNVAWFSAREEIWRAAGQGTDSTVYALQYVRHPVWPSDLSPTLYNRGVLYAGGAFSVVKQASGSDLPANHVAKWRIDTDEWSILGQNAVDNGMDGDVYSLTVHPGLTVSRYLQQVALVVGGAFEFGTGSDGIPVRLNNIGLLVDDEPLFDLPSSIAREEFRPFGSGTDGPVYTATLPVCGDTRDGETGYIGGAFRVAGADSTRGIAKWSYSTNSQPPRLVVLNASVPCRNCSVEVIGPQPEPCGGRLAKYPLSDLFSDLDYGGVVAVDFDPPTGVPYSLDFFADGNLVQTVDSVFFELTGRSIAFVTGLDAPSSYAPNPDGRSTELTMSVVSLPRLSPEASALTTGIVFQNGSTDSPAVDILIDGEVVSESVVYGGAGEQPLAVDAGTHTVEIRDPAGSTLGTWTADFAPGISVLALRGFVDPAANQNGPGLTLDVLDIESILPTGVEVERPGAENSGFDFLYPNPANTNLNLGFTTRSDEFVTVSAFDIVGRRLSVLINESLAAGQHRLSLDTRAWPSGVYLLVLESGGSRSTRRLLVAH